MRYCKRCCYPENAKPMVIFDEQGVCSGCRYHERRMKINWAEREKILKRLLEEYQNKAKEQGNPYDCIIPVSGGKDSHFQAYLIKEVYKMNPLLVTFNHGFNTELGVRNLRNLVKRFNCDLVRFTINPETTRKLCRYMLKKVGDITWHYHAGIMTFPNQIAVKYKIPLVVWGERGCAEMLGMFRDEDFLEFSKKSRREHDMRGFEPEDILEDPDNTEITKKDLIAFYYPSDEEIEEVGVRGIYLSNFNPWNAKEHAELMIKNYGFKSAFVKERTFNYYSKIDDAANAVHDYLKYLKFGYGRATDDATTEIRYGRMSREEGIEMVKKYDHQRPQSLDVFLKFLGITEKEFEDSIDHLRDPQIWEKDSQGKWQIKDSITNHIQDPGVDEVRLPLVKKVSSVSENKEEEEEDFLIL
ncbi:MAG: N-acetyl sugar amidotransferase [Candidatus Nealsonbacteria bacterium]